jgi:Carbohydrate binding domain
MRSLLFTVLFSSLTLAAGVQAAENKNMLKPTNKDTSWRLEQHEGGKGTMKGEGEAIVFTVTESDGTDWHVQAVQTDLDLVEGKEYVLKFQVKAGATRNITISAGIDQDDWHSIGLAEQLSVGTAYQTAEYSFRAEGIVAKKNRIALGFGEEKGTVTVKDMSLELK